MSSCAKIVFSICYKGNRFFINYIIFFSPHRSLLARRGIWIASFHRILELLSNPEFSNSYSSTNSYTWCWKETQTNKWFNPAKNMSYHWQFIVPNFWPQINSTIIIVYFALCKVVHENPGCHIAVNSVFHVLELNSRFHKQTFRNPDYLMGRCMFCFIACHRTRVE